MARGEIHVELSVDFADDPAVRALARYGKGARPARDLYVQMLCYCKRKLTDGLVPVEQVGILVYPDSPKAGQQDAARLCDVGLIELRGQDYYLPGFLKRNKSRADVEADLQTKHDAGVLGNHNRWHRTKPDLGCVHCREADPIATPIAGAIGAAKRVGSPETETETETETSSVPRKRGTKAPDDLPITAAMREWGELNAPLVFDPRRETQAFLDYHRAKGSLMKDWTAAWRTWMSKAQTFAEERGNVHPLRATGTDPNDEWKGNPR